MWHSKLEPADISAITRSVGYPMLTKLHNKLKLHVVDYSLVPVNDIVAQYTVGLENGAAVLYFSYDRNGLIRAYSSDSPFGSPQDWQNRSDCARSKNPRYMVNILSTDASKSGRYLKNRISELVHTTLVNSFNTLAGAIKRDLGKTETLPSVSEDEIYAAICVAMGDRTLLEVKPITWGLIEQFYEAYKKRSEKRDEYKESLQTMFNGEKWVIVLKRDLASRSFSYFVGAFDASSMVNIVHRGYARVDDIPQMTVPLQLYSDLTKLPDEFQSDIMGSLTMFKQYRVRNFPTLSSLDPNGYVPSAQLLFDKNSGAVAWSHGNTSFLMLDR